MLYELRYRLEGDPGPYKSFKVRRISVDRAGVDERMRVLSKSGNPYEYQVFSVNVRDHDWVPTPPAE